MSTTYSSSTKDASKDKDSTDTTTSTFVRSTDASSTDKTNSGGKFKSSTQDSDKTHDADNTSSSYGKTVGGQQSYGASSTQQYYGDQQQQQQQWGQRGSQNQVDVQQKLKEVGNLLQKAGYLLQDLQGSSTTDLQGSSFSRGHGGNYSGPYGGFESQQGYGGQYSSQQYGGPSSQFGRHSSEFGPSNRYDSERRPQFGADRWSEDRQERGFSGQGFPYSSRNEDRFESRQERGSADRYGGFGGPNRPDLAYGQQYALGQHGGASYEVRRGGDFESRRGGF